MRKEKRKRDRLALDKILATVVEIQKLHSIVRISGKIAGKKWKNCVNNPRTLERGGGRGKETGLHLINTYNGHGDSKSATA